MAEGKKTIDGLAVPLYGESNIQQITAADDILTITGATSMAGDFLVLEDIDETEKFVIDKNGAIITSKVKVQAKTAAYTVTAAESGTVFTTVGATAAVTFTLPAVAAGLNYYFFSAADVAMTVDANGSEVIMGFNDVGSTAVAFSTASEIIGGGFWIVSDGTTWFAFTFLGMDSQTPVLTT